MRPARVRTLAFLLLLPALAVRCGAAAPAVSGTLSDRTSALLVQAPQVYAPASLPGLAQGETGAIRAAFEGSLEPQARARLHHDPALDLVAAAAAENFSDQGQPTSRALMQWMLWRSGSLALYHSHVGGYAWGRGTRDTLDTWARKAGEGMNAAQGRTLSYGLARFTEGRVRSEMIVFGLSAFDAPLFPKTYAPGAPLALALKPRTPLREIRFLLDRGDAIDAQVIPPGTDGSFVVTQNVPAKPGRYFVEVQGPSPLRQTLLCVPIYVGVPEPASPDDFIQHPPAGPADLAGWPAWLASTYGAERARLGKPPLETDARLAALATERGTLFGPGRAAPDVEAPIFLRRLSAAGLSPRGFFESTQVVYGTDDVLLHLLHPSARERLVLSGRALYGAAMAPRRPEGKLPPSFMLVEETVTQGGGP